MRLPETPDGFRTVLADPPWRFGNRRSVESPGLPGHPISSVNSSTSTFVLAGPNEGVRPAGDHGD